MKETKNHRSFLMSSVLYANILQRKLFLSCDSFLSASTGGLVNASAIMEEWNNVAVHPCPKNHSRVSKKKIEMDNIS